MAARNRPYQRRRKGPVTVVVSVLAVLAIASWTAVLISASGASGVAACPVPEPPVGEVLDIDALAAVPPVATDAVPVNVLNAGGQRGQASLVAAQLGDLGFTDVEPGNDPFFPGEDMECYGQLRFGPAGEGAASTLSIVLPCVELVRDGRQDNTVDLAVGTGFGDFNPGRDARDALDQLAGATGGSAGAANADPQAAAADPAPPTIDPELVAEARDAAC